MEDSKTKYIESSLAAFRAIKTFVFIKGIYPRNFNSGFWDVLAVNTHTILFNHCFDCQHVTLHFSGKQ